jgi:hypothetical protein
VIEMMRKKYFNIPQLQCILCMITVFPVDWRCHLPSIDILMTCRLAHGCQRYEYVSWWIVRLCNW